MIRKRYCDIKPKNLEDALATCERHISNIRMTRNDLLEEGDGTATDWFYISMFSETWADMRDDIQAMIDKQKL